jgi:Na+/melibiose symporter-like transporter
VNVFKIDRHSFWLGETLFMAWNSVNDPLFAWLSDRAYLKISSQDQASICIHRSKQLKYFGPLLALAFMLVWFPLGQSYVWLQFPLCLCVYDTCLTIIDLQYSALLADLSISSLERNSFNYYAACFSAAGSLNVFTSYYIWCGSSFRSFQMFCLVMGVLSFFGFFYSTNSILTRLNVEPNRTT